MRRTCTTRLSAPIVFCDTGPLISILQSHSLGFFVTLFGAVHTSSTCIAELSAHGWDHDLAQAADVIVVHRVTGAENQKAQEYAERIAGHALTRTRDASHHLGEAEVIALAHQEGSALLLVDELAARAVAAEAGLTISGFAGVLLWAVEAGLLSARELKERLEACRRQGTHYSESFIRRIYEAAQEYAGDEGEKSRGA